MHLATWILIGLLAGALAPFVGRRSAGPLTDLTLGCLGAVGAGWTLHLLRAVGPQGRLAHVAVALLGASIALAAVRLLLRGGRRAVAAHPLSALEHQLLAKLQHRKARGPRPESGLRRAAHPRPAHGRSPRRLRRELDLPRALRGRAPRLDDLQHGAPALRSLPVHPAEPRALLSRCGAGTRHLDGPEPAGREGPARRAPREKAWSELLALQARQLALLDQIGRSFREPRSGPP